MLRVGKFIFSSYLGETARVFVRFCERLEVGTLVLFFRFSVENFCFCCLILERSGLPLALESCLFGFTSIWRFNAASVGRASKASVGPVAFAINVRLNRAQKFCRFASGGNYAAPYVASWEVALTNFANSNIKIVVFSRAFIGGRVKKFCELNIKIVVFLRSRLADGRVKKIRRFKR